MFVGSDNNIGFQNYCTADNPMLATKGRNNLGKHNASQADFRCLVAPLLEPCRFQIY
jgi:hypothetical protein